MILNMFMASDGHRSGRNKAMKERQQHRREKASEESSELEKKPKRDRP